MIYGLPTALTVCGQEYDIRTDFRQVLDVLEILDDAELTKQESWNYALLFFYQDFPQMPPEHWQEAQRQYCWFLNGGSEEDPCAAKSPRLMNWEQDFRHIIGPVNKVIGHEIRNDTHLHWWTFLSAFYEIGDCTWAQIVRVRSQRSKGKALSKADREWYQKNRKIVDLKVKLTSAEEETLKIWGGG